MFAGTDDDATCTPLARTAAQLERDPLDRLGILTVRTGPSSASPESLTSTGKARGRSRMERGRSPQPYRTRLEGVRNPVPRRSAPRA